jgi:uncharacterized protein
MSETTTAAAGASASPIPGSPTWIDASSPDVGASARFYAELFGWQAETLPPEAGGYTMFTLGSDIVAAVGPLQEGQHAAWSVYFATPDAEATAAKVEEAGGKVIVPPFDVLKAGRMAVFVDPTGAFFSVWQAGEMPGLGRHHQPNTFGWCELNTRGVDKTAEFYPKVFGWGVKASPGGEGAPPYTEWQQDGQSIGGAMDIAAFGEAGSEIPPHWLVYFLVADIEASVKKIEELGGAIEVGLHDYPGGRFAVAVDGSGAHFALMQPTSA